MSAVRIGRPRVHYRLTDSTNERARELARTGAPHGTVVTAGEQSSGRGRQGRTWSAPPGEAVLMSVVLRDLDAGAALIPLVAAVAVCEACQSTAGVECRIKWPNDVWVKGRKLAGILVEGRPQEGWAVLGIGLNVTTTAEEFPADLREIATSLSIAARGRGDATVPVALGALVEALEHWLRAPKPEVIAAWRERDALFGRSVRWGDGEGKARGITKAGALVVDTDDGLVELDAGEVHLQR